MSKKRSPYRLITCILFSCILSLFTIIFIYKALFGSYNYTLNLLQSEADRKNSSSISRYTLTIKEGTTLDDIADELADASFITNKTYFKIEAKLSHLSSDFIPGEYTLASNMDTYEILSLLTSDTSNEDEIVKFTIPEGYTIDQIAKRLDSQDIVSKEDFLAAITENDYSKDFTFLDDIPANDNYTYALEGYLFPDTYIVRKGASPEEIIIKMLSRFEEVTNRYKAYFSSSTYSMHEIITIASIIEEEVRIPEERAIVSGVIYNRLNNDMKLQMCSTVQYALGNRKSTLTYDDLAVESLYNTYLYTGLPIGPISCPGEAAITAALMPEIHDYYYFVLQDSETGQHIFSSSYEEHNLAKSEYKQSQDLNFEE